MKNMRKRVLTAAVIFVLGIVMAATPAAAASTKKQKKLAKCVDSFVWSVLDEARSQAAGGDAAAYRKAVKGIYGGKLTGRVKSLIAAQNTKGYTKEAGYDFQYSVSQKKVKKTYTKLFGKKKPKIDLPAVASPADEGSYVMDYAKAGNKVYWLTYDGHSDVTIKQGSVKKSGSKYIVTRKYKYYAHWGLKANGSKPSVTVTAKITMKRNKASSYGYKITGLSIK